jgi:hypothetical protein
VLGLWTRLRFASSRDLAVSAGIAIAGAVLLGKLGNPGGELFFGILLGLGCGLGIMALAVFQRGRLRG